MVENKRELESPRELIAVEHIRARTSMYLGSTDFFGFVQYLVSAFDLMLDHGATWIEFEIAKKLRLTSNARIPTQLNEHESLVPFEAIGTLKPGRIPDARILMALSADFRATIDDSETSTVLTTEHGKRASLQRRPAAASRIGAAVEFTPDHRIFSVTQVSPAVAHSYCKRTACLHAGVAFRIKIGADVAEYKSARGIRDFFDAIATPYQLLHKPIHIHESEGGLTVETVFVFHSWTENRIWSFANKGRVPDGGTHEAGMLDAIARLHNRQAASAVGVLAVLAIEYPGVTYEGCIKARIGNPELRDRVCHLVTSGLDRWVSDNPDEVEHLKAIERFQFADVW
jgi:DNA gyrase/topoisomerase IV subunit B